ncbi:hypothetical protein BN131_3473 [Cronobacter malonaticus 681]|nr:hypothetical protein BN131_3473 [Cronobacter malonaticus 681]
MAIADSPDASDIFVGLILATLYAILATDEYRGDDHRTCTRCGNQFISQ